MNILHIDSCALGDHSASRQMTSAVTAALTASNDQATVPTVLYRDLAASPLSHASGPLLQVISQRWDADIPMNAELRAEALQSASLLQEFRDADVVVLGAPMHNFTVPSTLKAWMDRLLEQHPANAGGSQRQPAVRVLLVTAGCGALRLESPDDLMSYHESQLKAAFQFMGIRQLHIVRDLDDLQQIPELKHAA
ncbi:FMN-dependent NADH-azoreductase [Pseudoduganella sp. FT55W]|uniref:FMN-dependent NADH-azoreductase n=1 Tax=Duganella rivi TaxID=2666083 RepID=A0A7X4GMZ1_9BURK|nr:NAD(P)H-dependent oxidoreductase [Duganella rivi]MYM66378.1 FMN-dependent NADH-azoreductase [Duganella rivi]